MAEPIIVTTPDGQEFEFPEGTSPEVMKGALQKHLGSPVGGKREEVAAPEALARDPVAGDGLKGWRDRALFSGEFFDWQQNRAPDRSDPTYFDARDAEIDRIAKAMAIGDAYKRKAKPWDWITGEYPAVSEADIRAPEPKRMNPVEAFSKSVIQSSLEMPVIGDAAYALADAVPYTGTASELRADMRDMKREAREDQMSASVAGDVASFVAPGAYVAKGASSLMKGASRLVSPAIPQIVRGSGVAARTARYLPVVAGQGVQGGVGYGAYNATVEAGNRAADEGRDVGAGERLSMFAEGATDPLAIGLGAAASPIYRAGLAAYTSARNTVQASRETGNIALRSGSFTPAHRAQWAEKVMDSGSPEARAYDLVAKRLKQDGITAEQLNVAIDNYHYAGYSTVEEMLFEIAEAATNGKGAGKVKELAVALGTIGGDAQSTARDAFFQRRQGSLERLRDDLRKAAGLEGSDFYQYADELSTAERTLPDYEPAYSKAISDKSWAETVWPQMQTSPAAREALDRAWQYASNRGDLAVAREIDTLIQGLGPNPARSGVSASTSAGVPQKPSTQALDYIDRSLGGRAQSLRSQGDADIAAGAQEAQAGLRRIVDAETGLDQPRRVVHELKTAQEALDFGRKAASTGTDLETIQRQFAREMSKFSKDGVEVLSEETPTINAALMMGWIRGAEDMISKATNPGTAIRQLYGSSRQRDKMVAMLQGLDESTLATSGQQSDATKRLRQVTGNKYNAGDSPQGRGRFDRERLMLDSENRIVANSQTGQRNEAVAAQGGVQRMANAFADAIASPAETVSKAVRYGINRATQPSIFNPDVNRELGNIMFTGGRDNLKRIVGQIETRLPSAPSQPKNAFSQTPQKQSRIAKTADVAALGLIAGSGLAPEAEAQEASYDQELASAQERIAQFETQVIPELQETLRILDDPATDPKILQRMVNVTMDGEIGPETRRAVDQMKQQIRADIETARGELEQARKRRDDLERAQALDAAATNPVWDTVRDKLIYPAALAGLYLGGRGRISRNRQAQENAFAIEQNVQKLLKPNAGKNALTKDANNLNEIAKLGGAGENVFFEITKTGPNTGVPRPKPNAFSATDLFPKGKLFDGGDVKSTMMFGLEAGLSHSAKVYFESKIDEAQIALDKALEEGSPAEIKKAAQTLETWKTMHSIAQAGERFGLAGIGATGAYGVAKRYPTARPSSAEIGERHTSVLRRAKDQRQVNKNADQ